jgi:hypothetical protein
MDGFKDSTRMKYMCGGPVKKAVGGAVGSAPMQGNRRGPATSAPTKGKPDMYKPNIARNPTKPAPTTRPTPVAPVEPVTRRPTITTGGTPEEPGYSKGGSAKKGVPAHNSRPMIGRKAGGLAVMPKGKC